jgi:lipopolysaccharide transport system permease protein
VDFVIAFTILVALMVYYGISPTGAVWAIPMFVFLAIVSALSVGLWLSALNVRYRDVRYTLPFITQFWFFISPVAYPSSIVPESWRWFYALNPMVGVIEGFRWALLGKTEAPGLEFVVSSAVAIVLFICGLYYFRRMERTFADVV